MMNGLGKFLVLVQVVISVVAMTWALSITLQFRDFGWAEPYREVVDRNPDGSEKKVVRHASEYDKSIAVVKEATRTRDNAMVHVQPALDSIRSTEPFLPTNHLFYLAELKRLQESKEPIEVKRLQDMGLTIEPQTRRPVFDKNVDPIKKSYTSYTADLKKLLDEIDTVEADIRKIVSATREYTKELTGTVADEKDPIKNPPVYVHPGLYQMTDLEFKAQTQLKIEIDAIKPNWSKAVEQARRFQYRRLDLEATLEKLLAPEPMKLKK